MTPEPLPPAASAEHLTAALRHAGVLGVARVAEVEPISSVNKLRSHTLRLKLAYDGPAAAAPASVILKTGHLDRTGRPASGNGHELSFYREVARGVPERLVPRCFEAVDAAESSPWHLLLEDLTDTHCIATEWPLPPATAQCELMVEALAQFHAAWWNDPRLGVTIGNWQSTETFDQHLRGFAEQLTQFSDRYGEVLPPERRELYQRLLDRAPSLLARVLSRRNLTIIHGDAHSWNFLLPRREDADGVRLLDWESWSIDIATDDLAYMMAMLWYPERRRRIEGPLLDRYHAALLLHGVTGYNSQALVDDYRLSALWLVTRPVQQAMANIPARVWWNNLERIFLAVDDLACRELLE